MATRADVDEMRRANARIAAAATAELEAFWKTLDVDNPKAAQRALTEFVVALVAKYGDLSAAVAADWFERLREKAGIRTAFAAVLGDLTPDEAVVKSTEWASRHLFSDSPAATLGPLGTIVDRYTLQPGRDTISASVAADPRRALWARVPTGETTCAFCVVMASRGAIYLSRESAGGGRGGVMGWLDSLFGEGDNYHGHCDCVPTPVWDRDELPEGYHPGELYDQYRDARRAAKSGDLKNILAEMRRQQGIA